MADIYGHLPRGPAGIMRATIWSLQGLRAAWLHESSFRLEVCLFVVLGPLGWFLGETGVERALLGGHLLDDQNLGERHDVDHVGHGGHHGRLLDAGCLPLLASQYDLKCHLCKPKLLRQ